MAGYLSAEMEVSLEPGKTFLPPPVTLLAGDAVNSDGSQGTVDVFDLALVASLFGTSDPQADINGDGKVDIRDLVLVGMNLGKTAPVPWPGVAETG
jgi:hypothetical protein